jgi:large subunit ribosomal protein L2
VIENIVYKTKGNHFLAHIYDLDQKVYFYTALTHNLLLGSFIVGNFKVKLNIGNRCLVKHLPIGTLMNNVEFNPSKFSYNKQFLARSAGCFCQMIQKSNKFCLIKLPSGIFKKIESNNFATIGINSNLNLKMIDYGKAGRSKWLKKRPHVRGVAMNPVDHPHGGGESKTSGGRHPVSAWARRIKK